jgi:hypothetical protein
MKLFHVDISNRFQMKNAQVHFFCNIVMLVIIVDSVTTSEILFVKIPRILIEIYNLMK